MKKLLGILLAVVMVFGVVGVLAACQTEEKEIIMITDIGDIDDQSFNQGTWDGVKAWAEAHEKTYDYIKPSSSKVADLNNAIDLAVKAGAKVIVTPGFVFKDSITQKAPAYPDVKFVLLDSDVASPIANVAAFTYKAEYSGYLAGYAAVKEGMTKLAYLGGINYPTVYCFGMGFVQGAEQAAEEDNISNIEVKWGYTGNFDENTNNKTMASAIYSGGTELIFSVGGANQKSCFSAASEASPKRWVMSPDTDGTGLSDRCLTSALKELAKTVEVALDDIYDNNSEKYFNKNNVLGIEDEMVGLAPNFSRFTTFTKAMYDAIYAKLVAGTETVIMPSEDFTAANITTLSTTLGLSRVTVSMLASAS